MEIQRIKLSKTSHALRTLRTNCSLPIATSRQPKSKLPSPAPIPARGRVRGGPLTRRPGFQRSQQRPRSRPLADPLADCKHAVNRRQFHGAASPLGVGIGIGIDSCLRLLEAARYTPSRSWPKLMVLPSIPMPTPTPIGQGRTTGSPNVYDASVDARHAVHLQRSPSPNIWYERFPSVSPSIHVHPWFGFVFTPLCPVIRYEWLESRLQAVFVRRMNA